MWIPWTNLMPLSYLHIAEMVTMILGGVSMVTIMWMTAMYYMMED